MKKTYFLLMALFLAFTANINAQLAYDWSTSRGYGDSEDYTADIEVDGSGNTYVATVYGNTPTNSYFSTVIKYDATGTLVAGVTIGYSTPNNDVVIEKIVVKGSSVYVTGRFAGTVDFDDLGPTASITSYGGYDAFIAKYNSDLGVLAWVKKIGGSNLDIGKGIAVKSNDDIFLVGEFNGSITFQGFGGMNGFGLKDIFICKLNSSGDIVWTKGMGGSNMDYANGICTDDIDIYILGTYESSSVELNAGGTSQTVTKVGGSTDMFIACYSADGTFWFGKNLGGNDTEQGRCIEYISNGNFAIGGDFSGSVDFDPSGGTELLIASNANPSSFLALYNYDGEIQWAKTTNNFTFGNTSTYDIKSVTDGSIYTTGYYLDYVNFTGINTPSLTSTNFSNDIFIAKYSPAGNCLWAMGLGSDNDDKGLAIAATNTKIIIGGDYSNTVDVDLGSGVTNINPSNVTNGNGPGSDAFVATYSLLSTDINTPLAGAFKIYPNPATNILTVQLADIKQSTPFNIIDMAGRVVYSQTINSSITTHNIGNLAAGIYVWDLEGKRGKLVVK